MGPPSGSMEQDRDSQAWIWGFMVRNLAMESHMVKTVVCNICVDAFLLLNLETESDW